MISNQRQLFLQYVAQTSDAPMGLEIASAQGVWLKDAAGKPYLDLISGIGPSILGHNHPAIVQAVTGQASRYMHTLVYGEMILAPQVALAQKLCSYLPESLNNVYFTSTGTEATEGAMKLARRHTGRYEIISMKDAYHGSTQGAMSLMSDRYFMGAYKPLLPGIKHITYNREDELQKIGCRTAAVVVETIKAESGIHVPHHDYLKKLADRCREMGALLILDEIQAAYGRTGHLFAFDAYGIVPDVLLLGKAFGGGMPLAAFIAPQHIMASLSHDPVLGHITTFGGHPVCCAAGMAVLDTLTGSDLIKKVPEKAALLLSLLNHPDIREIRHAGLWFAIELENEARVKKTIRHCLEMGLITDWFLFNDRCIRICPPLIISEEEIRIACDIILKALDQG